MKYSLFFMVSIALTLFSFTRKSEAHHGHQHLAPPTVPLSRTQADLHAEKMKQVADSFGSTVKPIFQRTCYNCHSDQTQYPAYYKLPGIKQLIDSDIKEAKEHIDFSPGFPWQGHGNPVDDLKAITEEIQKGDMPPFLYSLFHSREKMSSAEKDVVLKWCEDSLKLLNDSR